MNQISDEVESSTTNYQITIVAKQDEDPASESRYGYVKAVMLHWEDSLSLDGYSSESKQLEELFKSLEFETEVYRIPMSDSQFKLHHFIAQQRELLARKQVTLRAPCLLIIHYGGYGDRDDDIHGPDGPQQRRAVWGASNSGGPTLQWYKIQNTFIHDEFDVLIILDCGYAASAAKGSGDHSDSPYGRVELLAATGDTGETPNPGHSSFTTVMIRGMNDMIKKYGRVDISRLHLLLMGQGYDLYTVPFYVVIRPGPNRRNIVLQKLQVSGNQPGNDNSSKPLLQYDPIHSSGDISSQQQLSIFDSTRRTLDTHASTLETSSTSAHPISTLASDRDDDNSEASSTDTVVNSYINLFTQKLIADSKISAGRKGTTRILPHELEHLLKRFAGRLHEESKIPFEWKASKRLNRKSDKIAHIMSSDQPLSDGSISTTSSKEEEQEDDPARPPFVKSRDDVSDWLDTTGQSSLGYEPEDEIYSPQEMHLPQLEGYEEFISKSQAYNWLLSMLTIETQIHFPGPNTKDEIGSKILDAASRTMSSRRAMPTVHMSIDVAWEPAHYIKSLHLSLSEHMWDQVLCLTGSDNDLQAVTVATYLRMTWPLTGERLGAMLLKLLQCEPDGACSYELSSTLRVEFKVTSTGNCHIWAHGGPYMVSEFAEQIAWLATTLRLSPKQETPVVLSPQLSILPIETPNEQDEKEVTIWSGLTFYIHSKAETLTSSEGTCWTQLFTNPILVSGYPILRKSTPAAGLETSLDIMASLVKAQQVVRLENRIVMKGFSSLVIASAIDGAFIRWHVFTSGKPAERISYFDPRVEKSVTNEANVPLISSLSSFRHIIGWCSEVTSFCGHPQATLDVSASSSMEPPAHITIEMGYLELGQYILGGLTGHPNQHEPPVSSGQTRDPPGLLNWVSQQFIAFHDVECHRAWLVDGASALLHLVRISLHVDKTDLALTHDWLFDKSVLVEDWDLQMGRLAAINTLKNWNNRALPVYLKDRTFRDGQPVDVFSTFGERVDIIAHMLELLIEHQGRVEDGFQIPQTLDTRKGIVGFDIIDIIKSARIVRSRIKRIDSPDHGWVDLLSDTGILTIFGKGFGELLRPSNPDTFCVAWRSLPEDKNYLASSVPTLILLQHHLRGRFPGLGLGEFTRKLSWMSPCPPFGSCPCIGDKKVGESVHRDPGQYIVSTSMWQTLRMKEVEPFDVSSLKDTGAVVFANVSSIGHPVKPPSVEETPGVIQAPTTGPELNDGHESSSVSVEQSAAAQSSASTNPTEVSAQVVALDTGQGRSAHKDKDISTRMKDRLKGILRGRFPVSKWPK